MENTAWNLLLSHKVDVYLISFFLNLDFACKCSFCFNHYLISCSTNFKIVNIFLNKRLFPNWWMKQAKKVQPEPAQIWWKLNPVACLKESRTSAQPPASVRSKSATSLTEPGFQWCCCYFHHSLHLPFLYLLAIASN